MSLFLYLCFPTTSNGQILNPCYLPPTCHPPVHHTQPATATVSIASSIGKRFQLAATAASQVPQVPPSGNGDTPSTAQYTAAFAIDTSQASFTVYRQLDPIKWLRCTHAEGLYYKDLSYYVYKANGQTFRPPGAAVATGAPDPAAFAHHFVDIQRAERALEDAGHSATHDEGLMAGKY